MDTATCTTDRRRPTAGVVTWRPHSGTRTGPVRVSQVCR